MLMVMPRGDLLRRPVDAVEGDVPVDGRVALGEHLRDGGGERGLAVVDVPHRADVEVGLGPRERLLGHLTLQWMCGGCAEPCGHVVRVAPTTLPPSGSAGEGCGSESLS